MRSPEMLEMGMGEPKQKSPEETNKTRINSLESKKNLPPAEEVEISKPVIDMKPILEKVAPIGGVFSPEEELQKIWSVPREKRKEAISEFKDKWARQREAWALCRTIIEERIEANPDLPREEMVGIIREFARHYGFPEAHIKVAESLVDDYLEMHRRVKEVREKYPDNIALINKLTGMKFTDSDASDFRVEVGPMSIEIFCSGFNAGRIYEETENPVIGFKYGGFASQTGDSEPIYYLVVNNDYRSKPAFHSAILPHEREHQKNRLLEPKLYRKGEMRRDVIEFLRHQIRESLGDQIWEKALRVIQRDPEGILLRAYALAKDPEKKAFLLAEYMRLEREEALNRVKDELIAMKSEPNYPRSQYNLFTEGGSYDFLQEIREEGKKKNEPLWQEMAQRILVDEYHQIINNAIDAFDQLRNSGYSQSEVIAMLTDKKLDEWPKTARRLLEQKEKRQ